MGKVELELYEWRTEGPTNQVSTTPLCALALSRRAWGEWHSVFPSGRVLTLADGLWAG